MTNADDKEQAFLQSTATGARLVLLHGVNAGLAQARMRGLVAAWLGNNSAEARDTLTTFVGAEASVVRVLDAACATSLFGGGAPPILRVFAATERLADAARALLQQAPRARMVAVAGTLAPRSRLLATTKGHSEARAIPCPADTPAARLALTSHTLDGHRLAPEAERWIVSHLGEDRAMNTRALEAFALWLGTPSEETISLAQAREGMEDAAQASLEALVATATGGDRAGCARALRRLRDANLAPSSILSALARRALDAQAQADGVAAPHWRPAPPPWRAGTLRGIVARLHEVEARARMTPALAREIAERAATVLAGGTRPRD